MDSQFNSQKVTPKEQEEAINMYAKVRQVTDNGNDAKIKRKKDGTLFVYAEVLKPA